MPNEASQTRRDNFRVRTVAFLAQRVAYRCSNPDCRLQTVGPQQGGEGVVNVGVAAHITAAAPRGPRYDPSLTREERRHQSNGIWLCQIHAKQIDDDEKAFKVETLKAWKEKAEGDASAVITRLQALPPADNALDQEDLEFARRLGFSADVNHDAIKALLREAACVDIAAFKSSATFPQSPIALDLTLVSQNDAVVFDVAGLAVTLNTYNEVVVIAGPGTGKTTTAIQLVDHLLSSQQLPALYVPASEWALQGPR